MLKTLLEIAQKIIESGKDNDLKYSLCKKSFFPEVLPPLFDSKEFAEVMHSEKLPGRYIADFSAKRPKTYQSQLDTYIFRRPANQRRTFGIVHPVSFHALAHETTESWHLLHSKTQSDCSASTPSAYPLAHSLSAIQPVAPSVIERNKRLDIRTGARYIVKADITRFYPSIYTHSIAWAISGKSVIKKAQKDYSLLGNRVDCLCQRTQDGQTLGVSIGQDIFRVFAEIILADVDTQVGLTAGNCYRYSDDYEIACRTFEEAEQKIAHLERALQQYGLALNHGKTKILELPQRLQDDWIGQFGRFDFDGDGVYQPRKQAAEIVRLFDVAFDITNKFPASPAITYAIALLPGYRENNHHLLSEENVDLVERYLAHAIVVEPGCLPKALRYLALISRIDEKVKTSSRIRESLTIVLRAGIAFGIDSDITWSLYGHLLSGFSVSADINFEEAIKACRSVGRVAMLACYMKGLWSLNVEKLKEIVADSGIQSVDWLLIYELARYDICDVSKNKVNNSQEMKLLLDKEVSFFNLDLDMAAALLAMESAKSISYEEKVDTDYGF